MPSGPTQAHCRRTRKTVPPTSLVGRPNPDVLFPPTTTALKLIQDVFPPPVAAGAATADLVVSVTSGRKRASGADTVDVTGRRTSYAKLSPPTVRPGRQVPRGNCRCLTWPKMEDDAGPRTGAHGKGSRGQPY